MSRNENYPTHSYKSAHDFKSDKRSEVRKAIKAVSELRMGCAYFPDSDGFPVPHLLKQLEMLKDAMTVKRWGK
jgi:hypothetical protein